MIQSTVPRHRSLLTGRGIRRKQPYFVFGQISWQQQIGGTLHCWDLGLLKFQPHSTMLTTRFCCSVCTQSSDWRCRPAVDRLESCLIARNRSRSMVSYLRHTQPVMFGVPHGSVLGPLLYVLYTTELAKVVARHMVSRCTSKPTTSRFTLTRRPTMLLPQLTVLPRVWPMSRPGWEPVGA